MSTRKVDDEAGIGRIQLAARMRKNIQMAIGNDDLPDTTSSDTLPSSIVPPSAETNGSVSLPGSRSSGSVLLPSSDISSSDTLPSSESLPIDQPQETTNKTLTSLVSLPPVSLVSSETLPIISTNSSETLPQSSNSLYGQPVNEELFSKVLDLGMYELCGNSASASMLFYWAFTTQRRSVLNFTYSQVMNKLNYAKSRISRTLDNIRESRFFKVRATPKGVFVDLKFLIDEVKEGYPQTQQISSSETLPLVSSSKDLNILNTTTNFSIGSGSLPGLKAINPKELHVLVDLITYFGYSGKDLSPKLIFLITKFYNEKNLLYIVYNLAYARRNSKQTRSMSAYLIKTLEEDYGSTSLPYEDVNKAQELIEAFKEARSGRLDDKGASELRKLLFKMDKPIPEGTSRVESERILADILAKSENIYDKFAPRSLEQTLRHHNPPRQNH